jgi:hypothetical protein
LNYGNRFQNFNSGGVPLDEIEFEGHPTKFLGDKLYPYSETSIFFAVYWQQFRV